MPVTAYSKYFGVELDPEQLLFRAQSVGGPTLDDAGKVVPEARAWIARDVVCSSCGREGAQIVRSAKRGPGGGPARQSHFRFTGPGGEDAHHPFCEFHGGEGGRSGEEVISFSSGRSAETAWVRQIVCRGLIHSIFSQADIRSMRQWFFDTKVQHQISISVPSEAVDWTVAVIRNGAFRGIPFHPAYGDMPDFNWTNAARAAFNDTYASLSSLVWESRVGIEATLGQRAIILLKKSQGKTIFDVEAIERFYGETLRLAAFVAENSNYPRKNRYRWSAPPALLAVSALVLHICSWEIDRAIGVFARLLSSPPATDESLGNVMGLNPFHDYEAWSLLKLAHRAAPLSPGGFDLKAQLGEVEKDLRARHVNWVQAGRQP